MTPQEQQMIQGLADRINNTQLPEKDPDAENLLQQSLGRNPDALYILAQTLLVQQYALDQAQKQLADAKTQITQLQQQAQQPKHATSFLGNLLGHNDPPPPPPPQQQYAQPQYAPVPNYGPPQPYPPQPYPSMYDGPQSGGFLRSAMQTATGVAAGALAFEGIESLMHGFGHSGGGYGMGGFGADYGGSGRPEEVINNYYGDTPEHTHSDAGISSDIEDRRGEHGGSSFSDAVDNNDHGDASTSSLADDPGSFDNNNDDSADTGSDYADDSSDSGSDFSGGGDDSSF